MNNVSKNIEKLKKNLTSIGSVSKSWSLNKNIGVLRSQLVELSSRKLTILAASTILELDAELDVELDLSEFWALIAAELWERARGAGISTIVPRELADGKDPTDEPHSAYVDA
ncbi:hypothetical protein HAX54_029992 [Datura stramonium]|uniref:Uncharacterized protein n=1 Tax=Datura stramonium TaxID=4076 RepID=A0ABS8V9P3_DATST|nr:hypothetical protein [Datura stramonium]